jgi:integrase
MAKISLHLPNNKRYTQDSIRTLMLAFSSNGVTSYAPTGIKLLKKQWDGKQQKVIRHPDAQKLTLEAQRILIKAQEAMLKVADGFDLCSISAQQFRDLVMQMLIVPDISTKLFYPYMNHFAELRNKPNTRSVYRSTISRLLQFNPKINNVMFDAINPMWLRRFDKWLSEHGCPSVNARSIHFRNIRAVFNAAIDDGLTLNYPFRKFKVKHEVTRNKGLKLSVIRNIINIELSGTEKMVRDCFMFSFYLIGINMADIRELEFPENNIVKYYRQKTGKFYEFKLQREAKTLWYVVDWAKHYKSTHNFVTRMNLVLKDIGKQVGCQCLTTYDARYTWATLAAELDIPKETIAEALGHTQRTVTDVYITFNHSKIDKANRAVIDYVLGIMNK